MFYTRLGIQGPWLAGHAGEAAVEAVAQLQISARVKGVVNLPSTLLPNFIPTSFGK